LGRLERDQRHIDPHLGRMTAPGPISGATAMLR